MGKFPFNIASIEFICSLGNRCTVGNVHMLMLICALLPYPTASAAQIKYVLQPSDSLVYAPTSEWPDIDSLVAFTLSDRLFPDADADVFFDSEHQKIALQVRHVSDSIWATHYWRNGAIKKRTLYIQHFIWWHESVYCANGQLIYQGPTMNQPGERRYLTYYCNGHLRSDITIRDTQPVGHFKYWHPNGQLESELVYSESKAHGAWRFWDANGKLLKTETYFNDQLISTE